MRLAALCTGGKDSTFAAYEAALQGHELRCLLTMVPKSDESYLFQYPNTDKTYLVAEAMGLPLLKGETEGKKEEELEDLRSLLMEAKRHGIEGIVTGGIASRYQKERFEKVCEELGLSCLSPLWGRDPEEHLWNLLRHGFEVMIVSVAAEGLDASWLGKMMDAECIKRLRALKERYGLHMAFEGGEGETFVLSCPLYGGRRIEVIKAEKIWLGDRGFLRILEARILSSKVREGR